MDFSKRIKKLEQEYSISRWGRKYSIIAPAYFPRPAWEKLRACRYFQTAKKEQSGDVCVVILRCNSCKNQNTCNPANPVAQKYWKNKPHVVIRGGHKKN